MLPDDQQQAAVLQPQQQDEGSDDRMMLMMKKGATSAAEEGSHSAPPSSTSSTSPVIPARRFFPDGKVTSVDLTPDGTYVIAGCSDGTIRLYSMVAAAGWGREGLILGQIHAKGLITNLIFHVEVTDDGRFAFAGVLRGSVEMFAYDLTRLPHGPWTSGDCNDEGEQVLSKSAAEALIECHTNLDPKLRGFGAVARVGRDGDNGPPEYRLLCGAGIRKVYVFSFREGLEGEAPTWECIFDHSSNGMSIELLAFRQGGMEAVSKSTGQNLRVWDLTRGADDKVSFNDINNTQDMRTVCGDFAFGGTCQLSLVRLDAASVMNRMELALSANSMGGSSGKQQKRRQLCSVKDVVGTNGAGSKNNKVLVICSDGGVHCYEDNGPSATGELVPVYNLAVSEDDDVSFTLATATVHGDKSTTMVIQTRWLTSENQGEILVEPLRLGQPKEDVVAERKALGNLDKNAPTCFQQNKGDSSSLNSLAKGGSVRTSGTENDGLQVKKASKKRIKTHPQLQAGKDSSRPGGLGICKPLVRRPAPPIAQPAPITGPVKRKHYDPFVSAGRGKKGKGLDGLKDSEARRTSGEVSINRTSSASDFFRDHLARRDSLKNIRITTHCNHHPENEDYEEFEDAEEEETTDELQQPHSHKPVALPLPAPSSVKTWSELREKHQKEKDKMSEKFQAEYDWLRMRFLDAVERERLIHHIQQKALPPSSVKDPLQYLWWHNSRLPTKKQWFRQNEDVLNSLDYGLPRRFSLSSVIANYKDMVARMIRRQQVEADTLAGLQTMDLPFGQVQAIKAEYPYTADWKAKDPTAGKNLKQQSAMLEDGQGEETSPSIQAAVEA